MSPTKMGSVGEVTRSRYSHALVPLKGELNKKLENTRSLFRQHAMTVNWSLFFNCTVQKVSIIRQKEHFVH